MWRNSLCLCLMFLAITICSGLIRSRRYIGMCSTGAETHLRQDELNPLLGIAADEPVRVERDTISFPDDDENVFDTDWMSVLSLLCDRNLPDEIDSFAFNVDDDMETSTKLDFYPKPKGLFLSSSSSSCHHRAKVIRLKSNFSTRVCRLSDAMRRARANLRVS